MGAQRLHPALRAPSPVRLVSARAATPALAPLASCSARCACPPVSPWPWPQASLRPALPPAASTCLPRVALLAVRRPLRRAVPLPLPLPPPCCPLPRLPPPVLRPRSPRRSPLRRPLKQRRRRPLRPRRHPTRQAPPPGSPPPPGSATPAGGAGTKPHRLPRPAPCAVQRWRERRRGGAGGAPSSARGQSGRGAARRPWVGEGG